MCGCMPGMSKLGTVMSCRHHRCLPLGVVLLTPDEQHQHQEGLAGTPVVSRSDSKTAEPKAHGIK